MNNRTNYRILLWVLILGSLVLDLIRVRMAPGAPREVVRYVGIAMLVAAVVQMVIVRAKPNAFKDKSVPPDQETK